MNRTFARFLSVALVAPLALGACADDDMEDAEFEVESDIEAPATEPMAPMSIQLMSTGGSTVTGTANATRSGESLMIDLTLQGLTEGEEYEAELVSGTCATAGETAIDPSADTDPGEDAGDEIAELELQVQGTSATATTTVEASDIAGMAHIAITGPDDQVIACGDIQDQGMGTGMGSDSPTTGPGTGN